MESNIMNENLEDAAMSYAPTSHWNRRSFKQGANWQKRKDKSIIDKLVEALQNTVNFYEGDANLSYIERAKQLLNQIKDETK